MHTLKKQFYTGIGFFLLSIFFLLNTSVASAQPKYGFQVVAKTGAGIYDPDSPYGNLGIVGALGTGPSINDLGKVAFLASSGNDVRLLADNFGVIEKNFPLIPPGQMAINPLQINNRDHIAFNQWDNRPGPTYLDTTLGRQKIPIKRIRICL